MLLLRLFCFFSCYNHRLIQITVTFCFYHSFLALVFSPCTFFLSFAIQIKSTAKKTGIFIRITMKIQKIAPKCYIPPYLLFANLDLFLFLLLDSIFFYQALLFIVPVMFLSVFTFWYTREHQLNCIEILVAQHVKKKERVLMVMLPAKRYIWYFSFLLFARLFRCCSSCIVHGRDF